MCRMFTILSFDEVLGIIRQLECCSPRIGSKEWPLIFPAPEEKSGPAGESGGKVEEGKGAAASAPNGQLSFFDELQSQPQLQPHAPQPAHAYPGSAVPVIVPAFDTGASAAPTLVPGSLEARTLTWGYEANWKKALLFNTRLDGAQKPIWRDSIAHRRCLIPALSFFESHATETVPSPRTGKPVKRPYEFALPDSEPFLIGGIWQGGRFSMVTTDPNAAVAPVHDRMPLVLRPHEVSLWLSGGYQALADRSALALDVRPA